MLWLQGEVVFLWILHFLWNSLVFFEINAFLLNKQLFTDLAVNDWFSFFSMFEFTEDSPAEFFSTERINIHPKKLYPMTLYMLYYELDSCRVFLAWILSIWLRNFRHRSSLIDMLSRRNECKIFIFIHCWKQSSCMSTYMCRFESISARRSCTACSEPWTFPSRFAIDHRDCAFLLGDLLVILKSIMFQRCLTIATNHMHYKNLARFVLAHKVLSVQL
jgi:hypothetical protein